MPATTLDVNKQLLGHSVTQSWQQDACGAKNYQLSKNDLEIGVQTRILRTTTNTPGFKSPTRPKPLPYNNFSFESKILTNIGGVTYYRDNTGSFTSSCGYLYNYTKTTGNSAGYRPSLSNYYNYPASPLSTSELSRIDHDATTQVLNNVKDMKVNMAQFFAEREQAVKMFVETTERCAASFRALKKGDLIGAAEHLGIPVGTRRQRKRVLGRYKSRSAAAAQSASHRWLELQYGWKPLLQDVAGAAEAVAQAYNGIQRCSAAGRSYRTADRILLNTVTNDVNGGTTTDWIRVTGRHEIRYHLRFYPDSIMRAPVELGITNPLELAWELLPYSFVADWFADVGKCLSTLDATVGLTFDAGCKTEYFTWDYESSGSKAGKVGSHDYIQNSGRENLKWVKCVRTKLTSFPSARPPMMKDPSKWFSDIHLANAAALLTNVFLNKSRTS